MNNKASKFIKNLFSVMVALVRTKSLALKTKTAGFKTRLLLLGLVNNKKVLMTTISQKMHTFLPHERDQQNKNIKTHPSVNASFRAYEGAMVPRRAPNYYEDTDFGLFEEGNDDDDLTHSLFDNLEEEDGDEVISELELASTSVTELVKSSRADALGFNLEDEIDLVADVFIRKVLMQRRLQKQDSFDKSHEMNN